MLHLIVIPPKLTHHLDDSLPVLQDANAFCMETLWGFIALHGGVNAWKNTCTVHKRSIEW